MGEPLAGKTSFIAKLWLSVENKTCSIKLRERGDDDQYLREISQKLLSGDFPERGSRGLKHSCSLKLLASNNQAIDLVVPDLPGESWELLYQNREWPASFESAISKNCSILIFLRPDEHVLLLDFMDSSHKSSKDVPKAGEVPTEVMVVDWLQIIQQAFRRNVNVEYKPKIGIVLSAWDRLPQTIQKSPSSYLHSEMLMVSQFIECNRDSFDMSIFGLSVTGGDLKKPDFRKKFTKDAQKYGYLVMMDPNGKEHQESDITSIVDWAFPEHTKI